jgi:hypothetical protein
MSQYPIGRGGDLHVGFIEISPASAEHHEIYAFCHVFRSLAPPDDDTFGVGVALATSVPVIWKAPIEDPDAEEPIGLFDPENLNNFVPHCQNFIEIENRLLSLNDSPAQFTLEDLVTGEIIGHKTRHLACFEIDPDERRKLFNKAFKIYESLIMVCDNKQAQIQYIKISQQGWIFPKYGEQRQNDERQQCISRIFAGMAVCELMEKKPTYCSFASVAIHWASECALELACCLRIFPYVIATLLIEDDEDECVIQNLMDMTYEVSEKVLLPLMIELGRQDLFDQELRISIYSEDCRAECERIAAEFNRPFDPEKSGHINFKQVRGRLIERVCAKCGMIDETNHFKRCSVCHSVFYCGKECQVKHWKEHKSVCKRPVDGSI